ncbi:MAG: hypothetical protein KF830_13690 [Planctomycetes bacterium]|nr:hypothetical protein [Planctomycetota bacterium]
MTTPRPTTLPFASPFRRWTQALLAGALALAVAGCDDNNSSPEIGTAPEPTVGPNDPLPGVVVEIQAVRGGSGPSGRARAGDRLTVDFTVKRDNGEPLELATMARAAAMVSGPTFNYQRVIASQSDVIATAVKTALGAYSYTFAVPLPQTYLAPLNDTDDITLGELTGEALLSGTYTVGLELRKDYVIDGVTYRDPGNTTFDFLLGDATTIEKREVVTLANCNQCHTELRAHGDNRNQITNCLLCHTTGAEDRNTASAAGGTPGAAIDFKVMIHKIHAGKYLPSVLGVTTNPDGSRNYNATPKPYQLVGFNDTVHDFSHVAFPAWPSFYAPMPRDQGFTALNTPPTTEGARRQGLENSMRRMPVECSKCHGDPDGDGPLPAPAQGDLIWSQPTIAACASCHDDWVPDHLYTANGQTMPIQRDDATCKECHRVSGTPLDVVDAHLHPLVDPAIATGLVFEVSKVTDIGNGNGRFEPGEKIEVTFQAKNNAGTPVAASSLSRIEMILSGPTTNPQMINYQRLGQAYFSGTGPYTFRMPEIVFYERIDKTALQTTFATSRAPHWNVSGATTSLRRITGLGNSSNLAATATVTQNFVDVTPGDGALFAKDNYIVLDNADAGLREYMLIQWVDGDRLWFGSQFRQNYKPNLKIAHAIGATVQVVTTTGVPTGDYTLDAVTGIFTEGVAFGDASFLCTYSTDFVIPSVYPGALDDSPVLGEDWGDWTGLPLLSGTYTLDVHGARSLNVVRFGETTGYTEGADSTVVKLLFGSATEVVDVERIDPNACYGCHENLQFHGGSRRSVEACLQCHGTAGAENTLLYENPTGGNPLGTTVEFRHVVHNWHNGVFPGMPGGVQDCAKCHGENTAWTLPAARLHPQQALPTRAWFVACSSCHSDTAAVAHMDANTSFGGAESCSVCHGENDSLGVRTVHKIK